MKKTFNRVAVLLLTLILLAVMLSALSMLTLRKGPYWSFHPFYENPDKYELLFFGTSHGHDAFLPTVLWEEYGYASYNLSSSSATLPMSYWAAVNALDHCQPELLVVDCYRISYPEPAAETSFIHSMMDAIPLSLNKIRTAYDLCSDGAEALELLFPFAIYHSRWSSLDASDFSYEPSIANGSSVFFNVAVPNEKAQTRESLPLTRDMPGVAYLEKLVQLCRDRDIELLLTYLPYPAPEEDVMEANGVAELAREWGVNYINFLDTDTVDLDTDMYDSFSHLNYSGANKVSRYLGEYISENYALTDRRGEPDYLWMDQILADYKAYELELLAGEGYLYNYLLMLSGGDRACCIYVGEDSPIYRDETSLKLLENLPRSSELRLLRQAADSGQAYLLYLNNADGRLLEYAGGDIPETVSALGTDIRPLADQCIGIRVFDGQTGENLGCDRSFVLGTDGIFVRSY